MLITNQTIQDYWFGPLHLTGGVGQTLTVDDTSETSLYLLEDAVADAINNLYSSGKITVTGAAAPFPRPTGVPQLLHGDGSPEGLVYAPQGSMYMRRDGTGANSLYTKTTGVTINTGWENYTTTAVGPGTTYRKTTAKAVNTSTAETDLLNSEITLPAGILGTSGVCRLTAWGDFLNNSGGGAAMPRLRLKLGGTPTVAFDIGGTLPTTSGSAARTAWRAVAELMNLGAANSQLVSFALDFSAIGLTIVPNVAPATGEGGFNSIGSSGSAIANLVGTAISSVAVDTTVAMAIQLTTVNGSASASYETKLWGALVEII